MKCRKYWICERAGDECIESGFFSYRDCRAELGDESKKEREPNKKSSGIGKMINQLLCADIFDE